MTWVAASPVVASLVIEDGYVFASPEGYRFDHIGEKNSVCKHVTVAETKPSISSLVNAANPLPTTGLVINRNPAEELLDNLHRKSVYREILSVSHRVPSSQGVVMVRGRAVRQHRPASHIIPQFFPGWHDATA